MPQTQPTGTRRRKGSPSSVPTTTEPQKNSGGGRNVKPNEKEGIEGDYRLVDFDQAPEWMKHNPFILHGYRFKYSTKMCFRSFFHHHNETGNVWTHFIGLLIFFVLGYFVFKHILEVNWTHYAVFTFFMGACGLCMGCSCTYHLFNCHKEEEVASKMFLFDLVGIAVLIVASFFPFLYFGFACLPGWRITYLLMISILGGAGIIAPFVDLDERFAIYRTLLYVAITCSGLFPTFHILYGLPLNGPILAPMSGLALMFLLYGTGLIFYLARIPERWYPGHFDYWLSSHQIWHMFVLAAALVHFFGCISLYRRYQLADTLEGLC